jgi:hypothetical protein
MPRKRKSTITRQQNIQSALEVRALKRHRSYSLPRKSESLEGSDREEAMSLDGNKVHFGI